MKYTRAHDERAAEAWLRGVGDAKPPPRPTGLESVETPDAVAASATYVTMAGVTSAWFFGCICSIMSTFG